MPIIQHKTEFLNSEILPAGSVTLEATTVESCERSGSRTDSRASFIRPVEDRSKSNYHLPQVWAEFLEKYPWDTFGSLVPNDIVHPESLEKLWGVFIHHINRRAYGKDYWKDKNKGVLTAIGWERQRRGAPHGHCLIAGVPDFISRKELHYWLHEHGAHFSQLEAYEKGRGAEYYMSKSSYAWKHGEIDVSDTLARYQGGSWISAIEVHEQFCRDYGRQLRCPVSAYDWQA